MVVSLWKDVQEPSRGIGFSFSGKPSAIAHAMSFSMLFWIRFCDIVLLTSSNKGGNTNFPIEYAYALQTPRGFHVETTWKRFFPRLFNGKSTWCICRVVVIFNSGIFKNSNSGIFCWLVFYIFAYSDEKFGTTKVIALHSGDSRKTWRSPISLQYLTSTLKELIENTLQ